MTEQKNALAQLFAACWKDEALKARFMADPKAVLAEYDMPVPDGMDVKVVENADNCVHITMPAPPSDHMKLSDEQLSNTVGGAGSIQALSPQDPMFDVLLAENGMTRKQMNDALQNWC